MKGLIILGIILSGLIETPPSPPQYNVEGQEMCEGMCLRCIEGGGEVEECSAMTWFQVCCHRTGGRVNGCGCREGL